jgi:hypothetical protein
MAYDICSENFYRIASASSHPVLHILAQDGQVAHQIGFYSRPHRLAKLDGRTREALLRETRARLIEHVGGSPSAVQSELIERTAQLTLKVAQLHAKLDANAMTDHDHRHYLAWSNALTRTLDKLEKLTRKHGKDATGPSLAEYLAGKSEGAAA